MWQRGLSVSMRPGDWERLIQSLAGHDAVVRRRKWAPPDRARTVLVPLIRVFAADMRPDGMLGVTADLRGPNVQGKLSHEQTYPGNRHRVRKIVEWWAWDPWLRMRAELRDGSVLELTVVDKIRYRRVHKTSQSGKHKTKTKTKTVQRVSVSRKLPEGAVTQCPATPPPRWVTVKVRGGAAPGGAGGRPPSDNTARGGRRTLIRASAKLMGAADERALPEQILHVTTELFRWTPPGGATRRTG
ncbi:hypothetical protein ACGFNU_45355 [Spirillospora sp. NPDC048911]|uniref:hypothetical protein n=1 Tax=Spirillospora sp. NPDC048911 TaxID=3364527 RepID=UPI0037162471